MSPKKIGPATKRETPSNDPDCSSAPTKKTIMRTTRGTDIIICARRREANFSLNERFCSSVYSTVHLFSTKAKGKCPLASAAGAAAESVAGDGVRRLPDPSPVEAQLLIGGEGEGERIT